MGKCQIKLLNNVIGLSGYKLYPLFLVYGGV